MLQITIPGIDNGWDESKQEFVSIKECTLQLEHSLVSLKKWESKWHKPFLSKEDKTHEETIDYIRCMTITKNVNPEVYRCLTSENISKINEYISDPMTATWFSEDKIQNGNKSRNNSVITNETIYYWMITYGIPMECQKWHLNQLLTLIRVFEVRNKKPKKMSRKEIMQRNTALNKARREAMNSKG